MSEAPTPGPCEAVQRNLESGVYVTGDRARATSRVCTPFQQWVREALGAGQEDSSAG